MNTETVQTILAHRSVRRFRPDALPDGLIETLEEVMRRGPSSSAMQTYTVVFVREHALKCALQEFAGDQAYISQCPLFIVACADLRRVQRATEARSYPYRAHDLRGLLTATEDLTIAVHNASLAAQSLSLGTVMIGGVLNGAKEISALLTLPPRVLPMLGLCIGYPATDEQAIPPRPRLPKPLVFHHERYALLESEEEVLLELHDREVTDLGYYHGRRIPLSAVYEDARVDDVPEHDYGWTEHVARKQARVWWLEAAPKLSCDLQELGVDLTPPEQRSST